jgi:hypothetical protein
MFGGGAPHHFHRRRNFIVGSGDAGSVRALTHRTPLRWLVYGD